MKIKRNELKCVVGKIKVTLLAIFSNIIDVVILLFYAIIGFLVLFLLSFALFKLGVDLTKYQSNIDSYTRVNAQFFLPLEVLIIVIIFLIGNRFNAFLKYMIVINKENAHSKALGLIVYKKQIFWKLIMTYFILFIFVQPFLFLTDDKMVEYMLIFIFTAIITNFYLIITIFYMINYDSTYEISGTNIYHSIPRSSWIIPLSKLSFSWCVYFIMLANILAITFDIGGDVLNMVSFYTTFGVLAFYAITYIIILIKHKILEIPLKNKISELNVQAHSINSKDLKSLPIYARKISGGKPNMVNYIYRLDSEGLFPQNAIRRNFHIKGFYEPTSLNNEDINIDNSSKVLILTEFSTRNTVKIEELKFYISYALEETGRLTHEFIHIFIIFDECGKVVVPIQKYVYDAGKYHTYLNVDKTRLYSKGKLDTKLISHRLVEAVKLTPFYNDLENIQNNIRLEVEIYDSRKVIAHIKDYGVGKTTYDVGSIVDQQKSPVLISAWQDNYDHDILQLLFSELKKATGTNTTVSPPRGISIVFYSAVSIIIAFMIKLIYTIHKMYNFAVESKFSTIDTIVYPYIIEIIIIAIISILLFYFVKDKWIKNTDVFLIYAKDNTKIYKDFYIDSIVNMLQYNSNFIFVIEDIDRLDPSVITEIFRILAAINYKLPVKGRIFALVSYSETKLTGKLGSSYQEIAEKVLHSKSWGEEYKVKESMQLYCNNFLDILSYKQNISYKNTNINSIIENNIEYLSFRIINDVFNKLETDPPDDSNCNDIIKQFNNEIQKKVLQSKSLR